MAEEQQIKNDPPLQAEVGEILATAGPQTDGVLDPALQPATTVAPVEDEKILSAKLALEGEEWTKKRQSREQEKVLLEQRHKLSERLQEITKLKTELELKWVEFDSKRRELKTILDPIIKKEEEVEAREFEIENTERNTGLPKEKVAIEKKRWLIEDERRALEKEKWGQQEKLWKIEEIVEATTKDYRKLLDEEDKIHSEIDKIEKEMPV